MATVKLQDREIKKLKITVTTIKSVLIEKNKELKKVKLSKKRLDNASFQLLRKEGKEKSVEAVKKSSPLTSFSEKAGATTGNIIDKIKSFGWNPKISLRDGIKQTYSWYKQSLVV